jgi:hypothetical protein
MLMKTFTRNLVVPGYKKLRFNEQSSLFYSDWPKPSDHKKSTLCVTQHIQSSKIQSKPSNHTTLNENNGFTLYIFPGVTMSSIDIFVLPGLIISVVVQHWIWYVDFFKEQLLMYISESILFFSTGPHREHSYGLKA